MAAIDVLRISNMEMGMDPQQQRFIERAVRKAWIARGLAPGRASELAKKCRIIEAPRGAVVLSSGEPVEGIHVVAKGNVKLSFRHAGKRERVIRIAHAGATFGEPMALLGKRSPFEARALDPAKLVVVPARALYQVIDSDRGAARETMKFLAEGMFHLLAQLDHASSIRGSGQRLARYLESLAAESKANRVKLQLPLSKSTIASQLEMRKETLSRLLRSLRERGLVAMRESEITLLDRKRLARAFD